MRPDRRQQNGRPLPWLLAVVAVALLLPVLVSGSEDWPHWRGPHRNGVVDWPTGWDGQQWDIQEAWSVDIAAGSSSPVVVSGRLYTMGWQEGQDHVMCLDAETGERRWSVNYPCPAYGRNAVGDQGIYSGPSSTPEFDLETGFLYTLSTDGDLHCWNTRAKGAKVWGINLYDQYDVPQRPRVGRSGRRDYGFTSSPLVHEETLIVEVGATEGTVIGFDKRNGKQRWVSQSRSPAGHNGGPVPMLVEGVPCVAIHNHDGLLVLRIDAGHEGETVATWDWETSFANNIATPTVDGEYVLLTSSYNIHKIAKLRIRLTGAERVWEQKQASKVCSPVISQGHVYWAWRQVNCLDYETGAVRWQGGRVGDQGSVIAAADGRLIVWANRGDLMLVESAQRSPDAYRELFLRKRIGRGDAWPHVVWADERLFCKDRTGRLVCFRLP